MIFSSDAILQQLANDSRQNSVNFTELFRDISVGDILDGTVWVTIGNTDAFTKLVFWADFYGS